MVWGVAEILVLISNSFDSSPPTSGVRKMDPVVGQFLLRPVFGDIPGKKTKLLHVR